MGRLEGRVALVTGGASGIGAATLERFAREGARVAALDLGEVPGEQRERIARTCPGATFHRADVARETEVAAAVAEIATGHGGIDVLVNAAGVAGGGPVHLLEEDAWQRVLDVNLKGTFLVTKHVLPHMLARGAGSIVNLASVEGLAATDASSCYAASKGGVVLLTRNLAIDYGRRGIRANCLCPGLIDTPMTRLLFDGELADHGKRFVEAHQLGRVGRPDEVAAAALFLASDDASFVTGHALAVDGGFSAGHRFGLAERFGLG